MTLAFPNTRYDLSAYDFMDLMRDHGLIRGFAPRPVRQASTVAEIVSALKSRYRTLNYSYFDLMDDFGASAPRFERVQGRAAMPAALPQPANDDFAHAA